MEVRPTVGECRPVYLPVVENITTVGSTNKSKFVEIIVQDCFL